MTSEDELHELLKILDRIEHLNPQWELESRGGRLDVYAELKYTSSDGVSVTLGSWYYKNDDVPDKTSTYISVENEGVCIYFKTYWDAELPCPIYLRKYILNIANKISLAGQEKSERKKKKLLDEFMSGGSEPKTTCPRCNELISVRDNFCRKCGFALTHHDPEGTSAITRRLDVEALIFPKDGKPVVPISEIDESPIEQNPPSHRNSQIQDEYS